MSRCAGIGLSLFHVRCAQPIDHRADRFHEFTGQRIRGAVRPDCRQPFPLSLGQPVGAGVLFATVWSDVAATEDVAINITPAGGVRASKSFGW